MMRGVAWFLLCGLVPVAAQAKLDLHLPVDCIIGENCFIQNYFDHKAEAGAVRDYTCGNMSYDGHNGTDFRVPTYADLQQGIAVLAAADGTVKAVQVAPVFNEADIPMLKLIKLGMHNPCGSLIRIDRSYCRTHCNWRNHKH